MSETFYVYGDRQLDPVQLFERCAENQQQEKPVKPKYADERGQVLYRVTVTRVREAKP